MPLVSHQHPTLCKYGLKFHENKIARPNLSTHLFSSLFSVKMRCACARPVILTSSYFCCFLEVGSDVVGE